MNRTKICVNGSRTFNDYECMDLVLRLAVPKGDEDRFIFILGGARGADSLAKLWAMDNNVAFEEYPAKWDLYGKSAGYKRNIQMIDISNRLISFWDGSSKGTKHTIDYARKKGIPVYVQLF